MPERLVAAVMSLYVESRSKVKTVAGTSEAFDINTERRLHTHIYFCGALISLSVIFIYIYFVCFFLKLTLNSPFTHTEALAFS